MSDREKLLAGLVGGLLVLFLCFGVLRSVQSGLKTRQAKIDSMNRKIKEERDKNAFALEDAMQVRQFKLRSLPADSDQAHLEFSHWLEKQVEDVGLEEDIVQFVDFTQRKEDYEELSYTVSGAGDVRQVTELLYRIQSADTLHSIKRLTVRKQGDDANKLKLNMTVAALSMEDLDEPKVSIGTQADAKLAKSLEEYKEAIVIRNVFAPGNNAPRLKLPRSQTVELGKELNLALNASDVDGHGLDYALLKGPDDSAQVNGGKLTWKPSELGDYEFEIQVEDRGLPSKRDVATLRIQVVPERKREAPKREEFDDATVTELTGVVQGPRDPGLRILLKVQSKDEFLSLGEGDSIDVGQWQGTVKSIKGRKAVLESEDGKVYELGLGDILANAEPMGEGRR